MLYLIITWLNYVVSSVCVTPWRCVLYVSAVVTGDGLGEQSVRYRQAVCESLRSYLESKWHLRFAWRSWLCSTNTHALLSMYAISTTPLKNWACNSKLCLMVRWILCVLYLELHGQTSDTCTSVSYCSAYHFSKIPAVNVVDMGDNKLCILQLLDLDWVHLSILFISWWHSFWARLVNSMKT